MLQIATQRSMATLLTSMHNFARAHLEALLFSIDSRIKTHAMGFVAAIGTILLVLA
jgi:hypothetical protein